MFGAYDRGYDEGEKAGYNEAIAVAINLIQGDPRIDPVIGQDLVNRLESIKK